MRLAADDRAAATMFYIGYQASHFRARTINVALIPSIEAQALTNCEENPDRPVVRAFAGAPGDRIINSSRTIDSTPTCSTKSDFPPPL